MQKFLYTFAIVSLSALMFGFYSSVGAVQTQTQTQTQTQAQVQAQVQAQPNTSWYIPVEAKNSSANTSSIILVEPPTKKLLVQANTETGASGNFIAEIIKDLIGITAILGVIGVTVSGIMMFLSIGEAEKFNKAKGILIYALVGVGLASGAYLIVTLISRLNFS